MSRRAADSGSAADAPASTALLWMGSAVAAAALLAAVVLRTAGMTFIAYAFAADFLASPFAGGTTRVIIYALFALLSVAGPVLHAISLVPSFRSRRASPS